MAISLLTYWFLLRLQAVLQANGYGRSTFYAQLADGLWTSGISIGPRAVAWPAGEVAAVIAARVAGQTDDEIRALVKQLEAARKNAPRLVAEMYSMTAEPQATCKSHDSGGAEIQTLIAAPKKARKTAA